jgi:hypothetical protein
MHLHTHLIVRALDGREVAAAVRALTNDQLKTYEQTGSVSARPPQRARA